MNPDEPTHRPRSSSFSAEAILGAGITIAATGVLFLLLGWAQAMRAVERASWILLAIGAVLVVAGGVIAAFSRGARHDRHRGPGA